VRALQASQAWLGGKEIRGPLGHSEVKVISRMDLIGLLRLALEIETENDEAVKNIEKMEKLTRDLSCLNETNRSNISMISPTQ
jgi:hypothetical protein